MPGKRNTLARLFDAAGINRLGGVGERAAHALVLNYHRIAEPSEDAFDRDIISATPEQFADQLDYLARNYDVVSLAELGTLLDGKDPGLGRRVVITFDDGYHDNAAVAAPMLAERGLPAAFFLTSGFLDSRQAAWWDEIAWIVRRADPKPVELPEFGLTMDLSASRGWSMRSAIELYKAMPPGRTDALLEAIADRSGVGRCPIDVSTKLWMTWADAAALAAGGFDLGGHTVNHPVMSRLSEDAQRSEAADCRRRILDETGVEATAFSYPVGQPDSFTPQSRRAVADAGFTTAFSFYGGVCRAGHVDRFNVPRVAIESGDRGPLFRTRVAWPQLFA